MRTVKTIKIRWTIQNIDRVHRLLGIVSNWAGFFSGRYGGYKIAESGKYMLFCFYDSPLINVHKWAFTTRG